ncbi:hypothetical protein HMSSN036_50870 [Paenibacillus macerans]|nr:hypothetical protein HMSSN036_50870 [Paenibacillus macerans]
MNGSSKVPRRGELPEHVWTGIEALIVGPGLPSPAKAEWVRLAGRRNVEVVMIPDFYELYLADAEPQQIDDLLVYSLMPPHLSLPERLVKRLFDLLVSGLLLLAASPVMLFMFAAIPLTSKGKALYVQERVGLAEKPFPLYKFRSMVEDAEGMTGPRAGGAGRSPDHAAGPVYAVYPHRRAAAAVQRAARADEPGWPPAGAGVFHQPVQGGAAPLYIPHDGPNPG